MTNNSAGDSSNTTEDCRSRPMRVVLAGGGSAGHVTPLLALAEELLHRDADTAITVLGTAEGLEATLVPGQGLTLKTIAKVPFPRRPNLSLLRLPLALRTAVNQATEVIKHAQADVVVGMGGYVSTPAYFAARSLRVPIVVHEQNVRPGLANKVGARLTTHVATTFAATMLPNAIHVGMPLRRDIAALDRDALRPAAAARLGLDPQRTTLVVTGGSLGAQHLNDVMAEIGPHMVANGVQILHLTGQGKSQRLLEQLGGTAPAGYQVLEYISEMADVYAVADLVLCRAGANTVSELSAVGLPAVYVPLAIGNGEQRLNAGPITQAGGGLMVDNAQFSAIWAQTHVVPLLHDPQRLHEMGERARRASGANAASALADMVTAAAGASR